MALGRRVGLYRFCGDIGRGNFSKVKLAVNMLTRGINTLAKIICIFLFKKKTNKKIPDKVAVKIVDRGILDARALRMLSREVTTLECVHHPYILR